MSLLVSRPCKLSSNVALRMSSLQPHNRKRLYQKHRRGNLAAWVLRTRRLLRNSTSNPKLYRNLPFQILARTLAVKTSAADFQICRPPPTSALPATSPLLSKKLQSTAWRGAPTKSHQEGLRFLIFKGSYSQGGSRLRKVLSGRSGNVTTSSGDMGALMGIGLRSEPHPAATHIHLRP